MSPESRARLTAWLVGLGLLAALVALLLSGAPWEVKLGGWVLLTLLLDECGAWFGYTGAATGVLPLLLTEQGRPFFSPDLATFSVTPEWSVVFPLVAAGLVALMIVKHTGGVVATVLSLAVFVMPILLARVVGPTLDDSVRLPAEETFLTWALGAAITGVAVSLARRALGAVRRRERPEMSGA